MCYTTFEINQITNIWAVDDDIDPLLSDGELRI